MTALDPIVSITRLIEAGDTQYAWTMLTEVGRETNRLTEDGKWLLGDLGVIAQDTAAYGDGAIEEFAREIGVAKRTAEAYSQIARFYEKRTRIRFSECHRLRWGHFRAAMLLGDFDAAEAFLFEANDNDFTVDTAWKTARERRGKPAANRKPFVTVKATIADVDTQTHEAIFCIDDAQILALLRQRRTSAPEVVLKLYELPSANGNGTVVEDEREAVAS